MSDSLQLFERASDQLLKEQQLSKEVCSKILSVEADLLKYDSKRKQLEQHLERIKTIILTAKTQEHIPKTDQIKFDTYLSVAAEDGATTVQNLSALSLHTEQLRKALKLLSEKRYSIERSILTVQVKLDSLNLRKDLSMFEITNTEAEDLRQYLQLDNLERAVEELEAEAFAVKAIKDSEISNLETSRKQCNVESFIQDVLDKKI